MSENDFQHLYLGWHIFSTWFFRNRYETAIVCKRSIEACLRSKEMKEAEMVRRQEEP
jgi:hypothetical protein